MMPTCLAGWVSNLAHLQQVVGYEKSGSGITRRYLYMFPLATVFYVIDGLDWEYLITNIKKSIRNIIFSKFLSFVRPNTGRNQNYLFGSFLALLFYRSYFQHFSLASFS